MLKSKKTTVKSLVKDMSDLKREARNIIIEAKKLLSKLKDREMDNRASMISTGICNIEEIMKDIPRKMNKANITKNEVLFIKLLTRVDELKNVTKRISNERETVKE